MDDKLSFCREHLKDLSFNEFQEIYQLLSAEYGDNSVLLTRADPLFIEHFVSALLEYECVDNLVYRMYVEPNRFCLYDKYVEVGDDGVYSWNSLDGLYKFVEKKMNGEAMNCIIGFLKNMD